MHTTSHLSRCVHFVEAIYKKRQQKFVGDCLLQKRKSFVADSVVELRVRKYEKAVAYIAARPSPNKVDMVDKADEADEADAN